MDLSKELIAVLEKARQENTYFNPVIISGVLDAIQRGCPYADEIISEELHDWLSNMWSW